MRTAAAPAHRERGAGLRPSTGLQAGAALLLCLYALVVRTRHIADTFWLSGDQMRDWSMALAPWRRVAFTGVPSAAGGTTFGPIFYWTLWAIRHVVGPWTGNLPHAGGIGLAAIQSAADAVLFVAVWRRSGSAALALGLALLIATAPMDMALTAAMWNPSLAVALTKAAVAVALLAGVDSKPPSLAWAAAGTAVAWLAVQAHSTALFVSAPIIAAYPLQEAWGRRWTAALSRAAMSAAVIAVMQLPFVIGAARDPLDAGAPTRVLDSAMRTIEHPGAWHVVTTGRAALLALTSILFDPRTPSAAGWLALAVAACAVVAAVRCRRDPLLLAVTVAPLVCLVAGFSLWELPFDTYYALPAAVPAALTIGWALTAWRPAAPTAGVALAAIVLALQPARVAASLTQYRMPEYGALARGSRDLRRRVPALRRIDAAFALPASSDPEFLYIALGGRIAPDARYAATIGPTGDVALHPLAVDPTADPSGR